MPLVISEFLWVIDLDEIMPPTKEEYKEMINEKSGQYIQIVVLFCDFSSFFIAAPFLFLVFLFLALLKYGSVVLDREGM